MHKLFSVVSGVLTVASFSLYIHAILRKGCRPAKASWMIWSVLNSIAAAGMLMRGQMNGQMFVSFFGAFTVAYLATKRGDPEWHWSDKASAIGAAISLLFLFGRPEIAIIFSQVANIIAAFPTFRNAWVNPHEENLPAWIVTITAGICALLSVSTWSIASGTQPLTFFSLQFILISILLCRR